MFPTLNDDNRTQGTPKACGSLNKDNCMSNVSINNTVPMSNDYRPLEREAPVLNKTRDTPLPPSVAHTVSRDNGVVLKDGNVTLNKDAVERLLQLFEYVFKAIRSLLTTQGTMPNVTPDPAPLPKAGQDAGTQSKVTPEANPQAKPIPTPAPVVGTDTTVKPKVTLETTSPKVIPGVVPGVKPERAPENRHTPEVNVTVQVNCHCPHPEAEVAPRPPVKPQADGNILVGPKPPLDADAKPVVVPRPAVKSETDTKAPHVPKPATPQVIPDKPTPAPDLTSPGPADDRLVDSANKRNRPRPDTHWNTDAGRRTRA